MCQNSGYICWEKLNGKNVFYFVVTDEKFETFEKYEFADEIQRFQNLNKDRSLRQKILAPTDTEKENQEEISYFYLFWSVLGRNKNTK